MSISPVLGDAEAKLRESISLLVAYNIEGGVEARNVSLGEVAADGLRVLGRDWLVGVSKHVVVPYEATAELSDRQLFLIEDADVLAEMSPLYDLVTQAAALPGLEVNDLGERISAYGVVAGNENRIGLFKRSDPRIGFSGGRRFLAVLGERLERLEEPTFAFYSSFDFALAAEWCLVANQGAFEKLFRDVGLVERHIDEWVASVGQHLPWAEGSIDALKVVAHEDSRIWRRLREIHRRGHLATVTIDEVRNYATAMGLDQDKLVVGDHLVFEPSDRFSILHLLNEDLFRGPLTDERFEAQRKTGA